MELQPALDFIGQHSQGVLIVTRADGTAHSSNIVYNYSTENGIRISVTDGRAKTRHLRKNPRAALHVSAPDFGQWVAIAAQVTISPVTKAADDAAAAELLDVYEQITHSTHPDPAEFRQAMVDDSRCVLHLRPLSAHGQLHSPS